MRVASLQSLHILFYELMLYIRPICHRCGDNNIQYKILYKIYKCVDNIYRDYIDG